MANTDIIQYTKDNTTIVTAEFNNSNSNTYELYADNVMISNKYNNTIANEKALNNKDKIYNREAHTLIITFDKSKIEYTGPRTVTFKIKYDPSNDIQTGYYQLFQNDDGSGTSYGAVSTGTGNGTGTSYGTVSTGTGNGTSYGTVSTGTETSYGTVSTETGTVSTGIGTSYGTVSTGTGTETGTVSTGTIGQQTGHIRGNGENRRNNGLINKFCLSGNSGGFCMIGPLNNNKCNYTINANGDLMCNKTEHFYDAQEGELFRNKDGTLIDIKYDTELVKVDNGVYFEYTMTSENDSIGQSFQDSVNNFINNINKQTLTIIIKKFNLSVHGIDITVASTGKHQVTTQQVATQQVATQQVATQQVATKEGFTNTVKCDTTLHDYTMYFIIIVLLYMLYRRNN